jgi:hypothetical protein
MARPGRLGAFKSTLRLPNRTEIGWSAVERSFGLRRAEDYIHLDVTSPQSGLGLPPGRAHHLEADVANGDIVSLGGKN